MYNQYGKLLIFYILLFVLSLCNPVCIYTHTTSHLGPATFQGLNSSMWLDQHCQVELYAIIEMLDPCSHKYPLPSYIVHSFPRALFSLSRLSKVTAPPWAFLVEATYSSVSQTTRTSSSFKLHSRSLLSNMININEHVAT